jgi:hypothetical protein
MTGFCDACWGDPCNCEDAEYEHHCEKFGFMPKSAAGRFVNYVNKNTTLKYGSDYTVAPTSEDGRVRVDSERHLEELDEAMAKMLAELRRNHELRTVMSGSKD